MRHVKAENVYVAGQLMIRRRVVSGRDRSSDRRKRRDRMQAAAHAVGVISKTKVGEIVGLSTRQIERLLRLGRFPPALRFDRYVRWRQVEIEQWNAAGRPMNWNLYFKNKAGEPQ